MKRYLIILLASLAFSQVNAQHEHHQAKPVQQKEQQQDKKQEEHHNMQNMDDNDTMDMEDHEDMNMEEHDMDNMSHAFSLNLPMTRNGSGTGWLPDAAPMYGKMYHTKNWMYMLHGNLFVRYNNQDFTNKGSRGDSKIDAPNWLMFMGQRKVGQKGLFHFNTMFSLDAVFGGAGYPLLFQSGEAYKGQALVDRQHPHDLFSELSVSYSYAFTKKLDVFAYVGYPGEPAIGPVAFMHRPSALFNPDAPISHHWLDATHISFGVATLGVRYGKFKVEASSFTGREPDEHRYNFDKPRFDSRSARLSYNPNKNWALQVSHAFIKNPEQLHTGDIYRTTASAIYSQPLSKDSWINAALAWGMNKEKDHDGEHALVLEGSWNTKHTAVYGRYEFVQKSTEELSLDDDIYGHDGLFNVHTATIGANYKFLEVGKLNLAAGGQFSIYAADKKLDNLYGKLPMAFEVYIRLYPGLMKM
jgi:hypothetical protein